MSREIEFEPDAICQFCGEKGAYDFMGDVVCIDCMERNKYEYDERDKRQR